MIYFIVGIILTSLIFIIYINSSKSKKEKEWEYNWNRQFLNIKKEKLDELNSELETKKKQLYADYQKEHDSLWKTINDNQEFLKKEEEKKNLIISQKKEIINKEIQLYQTELRAKAELQNEDNIRLLTEEYNKKKQELSENHSKYIEEYENEKTKLKEEYNSMLSQLEDFQKRQDSINEAIRREKELQEKTDFYRICLRSTDSEDIKIIRSIEPRITNREAINKLIYDVFISRPLKEMEKRVLKGANPSGIYKITYIPTGESYIGKSSAVGTRWGNHLKTVCGLDGAAHQTIHTKMQDYGVENFTFELLEEVPKDKLSEREKFYINLYNTDKNGFNMKAGG